MADTRAASGMGSSTDIVQPPEAFRRRALMSDPRIYQEAEADPEGFWARYARELRWEQPWSKVLEWNPPTAQWFVGGKLNVTVNCVDRHLATHAEKPALLWEGEPGDERVLTYAQLHHEVNRAANALRRLGVRKGDRVAIYMPLVPELPVAMLACARIGAIHSVVFGGFSANALRDRIRDAQAKLLITADGGWRRGAEVPLKRNADAAVAECPTIEKVLVYKRTGTPVPWTAQRDVWWHEAVARESADCPPEVMDAEDPLFTLYTSGTTGKPKGVLHTTGGYLVGAYATTKLVFDLHENDVYFCTADPGWVTGHSYIVYGPLANAASIVLYEGAPDWPDKDRFWSIVNKHRVTVFYTAPTAVRAFMKWGPEYPRRHDLSSLRLLGSVGEPINPEAWRWYHRHVGEGRCPIVDTWWQTETGAIMITTLPGVDAMKPGHAGKPFPGIGAAVVDEAGQPVPPGTKGYLVLTRPWPAMARTLWGDPERYRQTYWSRFFPNYFAGDGAVQDADGYFMILGRVDDVMNVAGHRLSTMEIESALVSHPAVAEAAVVGKNDPMKGQAVMAYVILKSGQHPSDDLAKELKAHVAREISPIARPEGILFTPELPKTRSGKIMRRLLRDIAEGRALGDTTSLADAGVVSAIREATGSDSE
ncbi:MAG TPA: acetate--CoA ligase [Candidatus Thermoplasmatota archaeon]|nr:acetate--CoA ligase [Candidatus Thermoplasmatota archaeon]